MLTKTLIRHREEELAKRRAARSASYGVLQKIEPEVQKPTMAVLPAKSMAAPVVARNAVIETTLMKR